MVITCKNSFSAVAYFLFLISGIKPDQTGLLEMHFTRFRVPFMVSGAGFKAGAAGILHKKGAEQ
jgi:hypothetical protein